MMIITKDTMKTIDFSKVEWKPFYHILVSMIHLLYEQDPRFTGIVGAGIGHVVLDENNLEDTHIKAAIEFMCDTSPERTETPLVRAIMEYLLRMTIEERIVLMYMIELPAFSDDSYYGDQMLFREYVDRKLKPHTLDPCTVHIDLCEDVDKEQFISYMKTDDVMDNLLTKFDGIPVLSGKQNFLSHIYSPCDFVGRLISFDLDKMEAKFQPYENFFIYHSTDVSDVHVHISPMGLLNKPDENGNQNLHEIIGFYLVDEKIHE